MIAPDKLLPKESEVSHWLLQWSEDMDSNTWKIANLTNDLIDELAVENPKEGQATKNDIYVAVSVRCKGRKKNTIRRWAECARDYPKDIQDAYSQLLSFEHFKVSRRLYHEGLTPSLEYGLQWCIEGDDDKITAGKFKTAGQLLNHFVPEFSDPTPRAYWGRFKEDLYDQLILIDNDTDRERAVEAWKVIDYVLNKTESALDKKQNL